MNFEDFTPELQEKVKGCKSAEDLMALAKEEGMELTDEQLDAIAGGSWNACSNYSCSGLCSGFFV